MLRRTLSRLVLIVPVLLLAAPSAYAQEAGSRHQVGGFVGFQIFDVDDTLADAGVDIDNQVAFGGRYEFFVTPNIGVGGEVSFSPAEATIASLGEVVDIDTWYANGNVTYHFLQTGVVHPFATGGAGVVVIKVDDNDAEYFPSVNFGGGVMAPVTDKITVRGDVRGLLYFVDDLDPTTAAILGAGFDETLIDVQISGGVSFRF